MDKDTQRQLGKERKAYGDRKREKRHKRIADLKSAPNFKPFGVSYIQIGRKMAELGFLGHWLC